MSIFSNKSTHQVALNLDATACKITTEDPEKSSKAHEQIPADYNGENLVIGYNAEYLKDVIAHVAGDRVVAEFNTSISAALFNPEKTEDNIDCLMLLMPIRLND